MFLFDKLNLMLYEVKRKECKIVPENTEVALLDINDDCIYRILSRLPPQHLSYINLTCKRPRMESPK